MKKNLIEVRQISNSSAKQIRADEVGKREGFGAFTMFPNSVRSFVPMKKMDGTFLTGMDSPEEEEKRKQIAQVLNVDLSPTSSFWETFRIVFAMPEGVMHWDISKPEEYLRYKAALANKFVAPDEESIKDDESYYGRTFFYVHDKDAAEKKTSLLNELRDEISGILFKYRNNKDRLMYLASGLGKFVNDSMKVDSLYNILSTEKQKLTKIDALERFRDYLKLNPATLQAMHYVKQSIQCGVVRYDSEAQQYKFPLTNTALGKSPKQVEEFFSDEKNAEQLAILINEVTDAKK